MIIKPNQFEAVHHANPLPDERIPALTPFAFLTTMRIVPAKAPFTPEQQAKIKAVLPQTQISFK